jgi:hypothetical protein
MTLFLDRSQDRVDGIAGPSQSDAQSPEIQKDAATVEVTQQATSDSGSISSSVQDGVKKAEGTTQAWTKRELTTVYVL